MKFRDFLKSIKFAESTVQITSLLGGNNKSFIFTLNPEFLLLAAKFPALEKQLELATLATVDGAGLEYALAAYGLIQAPRITGHQVMDAVLADSASDKVAIIGGTNQIDLDKFLLTLQSAYPEKKFYGWSPPYIPPRPENKIELPDEIAIALNEFQPKVVLIALRMGLQLAFADSLQMQPWNALVIGVGGALDVQAGIIDPAPARLKKLGLEWLWRLWQEPLRGRRIFNAIIVFPLRVAYDNLRSGQIISATKRVLRLLQKNLL